MSFQEAIKIGNYTAECVLFEGTSKNWRGESTPGCGFPKVVTITAYNRRGEEQATRVFTPEDSQFFEMYAAATECRYGMHFREVAITEDNLADFSRIVLLSQCEEPMEKIRRAIQLVDIRTREAKAELASKSA